MPLVQMSWVNDCKKLLQQIKKSPNADPFLYPVDWKGLKLHDYPTIIKRPMDLTTMTTKLTGGQYPALADLVSDFDLIVSNCKTYNAENSPVYDMAAAMADEFHKSLKMLTARRWQDDAKKITALLKKNPNAAIFLEPVDWKGLGLTDYLKVIKRPMDLGTVSTKLGNDEYQNIESFFDDVTLIWSNCMVYNADGSEVYTMASQMEAETERLKQALETGNLPAGPGRPSAAASGGPKRKAEMEVDESTKTEETELDNQKRSEDIVRLGKRFASLQNDYLASAIRFIYAKCPHAVRPVESGQVDIDMEAIAKDPSSCDSINQLVKVMVYLQQNPE